MIDLAKTPSFRLDGKRALVTGGGRGIGLASASALAAAGAHVTLVARTKAEIEDAAAAIRARGEKADALVLDVTDVEAAKKALAPDTHAAFEGNVRSMYKQQVRISIEPRWARFYDFGAGRLPAFLTELAASA